jgi:cytoskeletal protein RodZ
LRSLVEAISDSKTNFLEDEVMQTQKSLKDTPQKKNKKRMLKFVLVFIVILIVLVVFLVPVFVSSAKGRNFILAKINDSIDGKTDFADLSMGWLKGVRITDFSFNDSRGQTSVKAKQIATKPQYGSILSGSVSLGKTIIDEPRVEINLKARQPKETAGPKQKTTTGTQSMPIALPIKKMDLVINNGNVKVTDRHAKTVQLSQIDSQVNLRPPGQETNFTLHTFVANAGKKSEIQADGRITPGKAKKGWTLKDTSGTFSVQVTDLNLPSLAPFLALAGVDVQADGVLSGNVSGDIKDGQLENINADIKAKNLEITGPLIKGDRLKTNSLNLNAKLKREQKMIHIESLDITTDWLKAQAEGSVPATFDSFSEFLQSDSNLAGNFELDAAQVLSQMPQTFRVKEGMKVTSGKLSGTVSTATKDGKRKVNGNAILAELKGTVDDKSIALQQSIKAEADITAEKDKVTFDNVGLAASFGKIDCTGTSKALKYNANINLASLQSELGQFIDIGQYKMSGELSANGDASIGKDKIATSGSSTVKNLRLSSAKGVSGSEPMANITYSIVAEPNKGILNIGSVNANASLGQVNINNAVVPLNKKAQKPFQMAVSASKVDLEKVQPFAVLLTSFPKEMQLAGFAQSDVSISSENQVYRILTDATHIKNLKVIYPEKKPFEANDVSINFDAEVDPEQKTINVKKLQLISPQIKIHKGEFSQVNKSNKTKLVGRLDCEYDWSAVSTITAPYLPQGLSIVGQRKDTISFDCEYPTDQKDKLLEKLNTKARVGFTKAQYMGLNFGPTDVDIQIQSGLLRIAPFSTKVNNGQFSFASEANFKDTPSLLKTTGPIQMAKDIQITNEIAARLLKYVNPIFANLTKVSGLASFNCERLAIPMKKVNKNEIEVIGTISVNQLYLEGSDFLGQMLSLVGSKVPGQQFTIRPTRFVLQNGLLQYEDMQLDVGDNPVNFKGAIGLDKRLNMTVTLPYTMGGRTVRVGEKTEERISLPLTGSIDKPKLDLGKLLEDQLRKRLEEQLQKGLEKLFE